MMSPILKREAIVLAGLLGAGVLLLPFAVYGVGVYVIGEYEPGADAFSFAIDLWLALGRGHWAAWVLVTSPYLCVQALRLAGTLWRSRRPVTRFTESAPDTRNWRV